MTIESRSCYSDEVFALRDMLEELRADLRDRERLPEWRRRKASVQNAMHTLRCRIEALRTAIEALGGEL